MPSGDLDLGGYAISLDQWLRLVEAVRHGAFFTTACDLAGVNYGTFWTWMRKGGDGKEPEDAPPGGWPEPYRSFCAAVRTAEAQCVHAAEQALISHMATDWRAAAHVLARKRPKEWGTKEEGPSGVTQQVVVVLPSNNRDTASEIDVEATEVG